MSKGKFILNTAGVRELLRSDEMAGVCAEYGAGILARAGAGFSMDTYVGKNRVNAQVKASTREGARKCVKDNALLKAVGK